MLGRRSDGGRSSVAVFVGIACHCVSWCLNTQRITLPPSRRATATAHQHKEDRMGFWRLSQASPQVRAASVLVVGGSGGTHWFEFSGGKCLQSCAQQPRQWCFLFCFWRVGGGGGLAPLLTSAASVPRRPRRCVAFRHSQDHGPQRALTTTNDVGNAPQGPRGRWVTERYPVLNGPCATHLPAFGAVSPFWTAPAAAAHGREVTVP